METKTDQFRAIHGMSMAVIVALSFCVFAFILELILSLVFIFVVPDLSLSEEPTGSQLIIGFAALGIGGLRLISYIGSIILFLVWIHRAYKNLLALDILGLEATPGWAVGYWFIPFLSVFKPLGIVNEIYHFSDPKNHEEVYGPINYGSTALTGFWWASWIVFLILTNLGRAFERGSQGITAASLGIDIASLAISSIAGVLLITIIRRIDTGQTYLGNKTQIAEAALPPPPGSYFEQDNDDGTV